MSLTTIKFALVLLLYFPLSGLASESYHWNGKRAAVVLTYDDSLNVHLDKVMPALKQRHFVATFYLTVNAPGFSERIGDWRQAAKQGHELGNHTLFHPCAGNLPGREWVAKDYDLNTYSMQRYTDEIALTNSILHSVDGLSKRTFAYTCGDTKAGNDSVIEAVKPLFVAARGVANNYSSHGKVNLYNINALGVHQHSAEELIQSAQKAISDESLLVFLFHGVGGEHSINTPEKTHNKLLDFLDKNRDEIWVTNMRNVANFVRQSNEN